MLVFTQQAMCLHGLSVGTAWKGARFWAIFLHSLPTVMPRGCTWEGQLEMLVCKCVWLVYVRRIRDRLKHLPPLRVCFVCGLRFVLFYFFRQTSMMFNWSFLSVFTRWPEQICSPNMVRGKGEKKKKITRLKLPGRCTSQGFVIVPLLLLLIDFTSQARQAYQPNASLSNDWDPISA